MILQSFYFAYFLLRSRWSLRHFFFATIFCDPDDPNDLFETVFSTKIELCFHALGGMSWWSCGTSEDRRLYIRLEVMGNADFLAGLRAMQYPYFP